MSETWIDMTPKYEYRERDIAQRERIAALEAENARLREALKGYMSLVPFGAHFEKAKAALDGASHE
jgi:hypothetical protein